MWETNNKTSQVRPSIDHENQSSTTSDFDMRYSCALTLNSTINCNEHDGKCSETVLQKTEIKCITSQQHESGKRQILVWLGSFEHAWVSLQIWFFFLFNFISRSDVCLIKHYNIYNFIIDHVQEQGRRVCGSAGSSNFDRCFIFCSAILFFAWQLAASRFALMIESCDTLSWHRNNEDIRVPALNQSLVRALNC